MGSGTGDHGRGGMPGPRSGGGMITGSSVRALVLVVKRGRPGLVLLVTVRYLYSRGSSFVVGVLVSVEFCSGKLGFCCCSISEDRRKKAGCSPSVV